MQAKKNGGRALDQKRKKAVLFGRAKLGRSTWDRRPFSSGEISENDFCLFSLLALPFFRGQQTRRTRVGRRAPALAGSTRWLQIFARPLHCLWLVERGCGGGLVCICEGSSARGKGRDPSWSNKGLPSLRFFEGDPHAGCH